LTNQITKERLDKYFSITEEAFQAAKVSKKSLDVDREDFLDMISRYISDAKHFAKEGRIVDAFACLNYAHGWLDAGARIKVFDVKDSRLFTVDE
jgi:uncharacterized protein